MTLNFCSESTMLQYRPPVAVISWSDRIKVRGIARPSAGVVTSKLNDTDVEDSSALNTGCVI